MDRDQTTNPAPLELPPRLVGKLEQYRTLVWRVKIAEGLLAALFGLAASYLLVFCLDRLFDTPAVVRGLLLLVGSLGAAVFFPLKLHNWVWTRRSLDQVVRLVSRTHPRFGDHLLGIVELAQQAGQQGASRTLAQAAMRQVDEELAQRDLGAAVPDPRHWRWAWMAGVPLSVAVAIGLFLPEAGRNALLRWLTPWSDVDRYTFAQLAGEAAPRVVPYAEAFEVRADLTQTSPWKPDSASVRYGTQAPLVVDREGGGYLFELPPQTKPGTMELRVGDARRDIPVEPKARPALVALAARVSLPVYLEREQPLDVDVRAGRIGLVHGSTATFEITASRELEEMTLDGRPQEVSGAQVVTEPLLVQGSVEYLLAWRDRYGLDVKAPQALRVEAEEDEAPSVALLGLESGEVVLSTQVLTFQVEVADDFGVRGVGLEWRGLEDPIHNPEPTAGEKVVAAGSPAAEELVVSATFSAEREGVRPQSLRLQAFADDYLPGRERTYSAPVVLHILTPAQHLQWLTEQLGEWTEAAQEVYEEELSLHQTNQELAELSPEELAAPEAQTKLQEQAAAEAANAAQLSALVEIGEELLSEATQNEEFDPDQLEALAELLELLEEIAGEQMTSIAELLAQAAEAPMAEVQGEPTPEAPPGETAEPLPGEPGEAEPADEEAEPEPGLSAPPGGNDLGLEGSDKYGPEDVMPEGLKDSPEDPNEQAAHVVQDKSEQAEGDPGYLPANPTPLVDDFESNFNEAEEAEDAPQLVGGLGPPSTVLEGSGKEPKEAEEGDEEESASELVLIAVSEQAEVLEAFAALAEEMNALLMGFESATFVKRLKAASRRQVDLAGELGELDGFGDPQPEVASQAALSELSQRQVAEAQILVVFQEDLEAYADRKPSTNYSRVLGHMQVATVDSELRFLSEAIGSNEVGRSVIESEYWADTIDRWAEQLVDPLPDAELEEMSLIEAPSLTPEMVLEIMRILDREVQLREEVRELHQAGAALQEGELGSIALDLGIVQAGLADQSRVFADEISKMPYAPDQNAETLARELAEVESAGLTGEQLEAAIQRVKNRAKIGLYVMNKLLDKLRGAAEVMDEVVGRLGAAETGPETNAAISEVIEILLDAHRLPNAPMIMKSPPASVQALALTGSGDDGSRAFLEGRAPRQATGKTGRVLPEEYARGLDAYMSALEGGE